jgi:hypothetical protein
MRAARSLASARVRFGATSGNPFVGCGISEPGVRVTARAEQEPVDLWFGTLLPVGVDRFSVDARSGVSRCAQSARWVLQLVTDTLAEASAI